MGNGRRLGSSLGKSWGSSAMWMRAFGAVLALLVAGSVLLGLGSHRYGQRSTAQVAGSPIPTAARSFLQGPNSTPDARAVLGGLPLIFEPNQGQADGSIKFLAQGAGYSLLLDATGATLGMQTYSASAGRNEHFVRMELVGANPAAVTAGAGPLPGKSNYLIGNDPQKWHRGIPQFSGVRYASVYRGIDLLFYGKQGHLEYDFTVAPGADPSLAELQFEGASKLELSGGDLILTGANDGGLRLQAPQIYQRDGNRRKLVAGRFVLRADNRVGFEIGSYDRSRELVIDPVLAFSTYFGGSGSTTSPSVAVNGNGNIYLVGSTTSSSGFPIAGTLLPKSILPNIFVTEITPSQPAGVRYLTFLGGSGVDSSVGLGVDGGGNAYIVGNTSSTDFPTGGVPYQSAPRTKTQCTGSPTCNSVFVSELDPTGASLIYSSFLSGNGDDEASGMAIDTNRDVFVTGTTTSTDSPSQTDNFPASNLPIPYQTVSKANIQFFVTEVNTNAPGTASIAYSTYFGGGPVSGGTLATGGGIAVDSTGNVYFSGTTNFYNSGLGQFGNSNQSTDFPILNAYQPCLDTPPPTVLSNPNSCSATALSTPYPTDAFVAKLTPANAQTGNAQLIFSTYVGGTQTDSSTALATDPSALNIYITGATNSGDFVLPTGVTPFQSCLDTPPPALPPCAAATATDAYVARLSNPTLSTNGTQVNVALTYFSYLGGSGNDSGAAIAVDTASDAFVTGATSSTNFPVTAGAIQSTLAAGATQNAFFAHIDTSTVTGQTGIGTYSTYFGGNGSDRGTSIAVDTTTLNSYFAGDTTSTQNFPTENALQTALSGTRDAFVAELVPAPDVTVTPTVTTVQTVSAGNQVTLSFTVTNQGPDLATGVYVNGAVSSTDVAFNSATATSGGSCSGAVLNSVVCLIPTLQAGSTSTVNFVVTPSRTGSFEATASVVKINNTNTNLSASASFTAGGFSMSISPSSQTVVAGQTAPYTVQLTPQGAFGANVSLTCSGAPAGAACNFSSTSVLFSGGTSSASSALNLTTTPQPIAIAKSGGWRGPFYALWLMIPGMAVFGLGSKRRRSRWVRLLAPPTLLGLVLFLPACSSSKTQPQVSGTPSGTYSLKVTASSGTLSQSQSFQLTVTP